MRVACALYPATRVMLARQYFATQGVAPCFGDADSDHFTYQTGLASKVHYSVALSAPHQFIAVALGDSFHQYVLQRAHAALADACDIAVDHGL